MRTAGDTKRQAGNPAKAPVRNREYIAGLEKGLGIIEAFSNGRERLSVSEAAESVGLSRAAARRCLLTLVQLDYAEYDGKYFRLAPRTMRLGHAYISSNILARLVQPILEPESERLGESMAAAVLDGTTAAVIARTAVRKSLSGGLVIGMRLPVYCSAIGRVLLAAMPDADAEALLKQCNRVQLTAKTKTSIPDIMGEVRRCRAQGYAINDQEVEIGLRTIAVPVLDRSGRVCAGMSVSTSVSRGDTRTLVRKLLPGLDAARRKLVSILHS